jgi:hypothetical protein
VTCIEFSFFQSDTGLKLLSHDIVVGREPEKLKQISSGSLPVITQETFINSLDDHGRDIFKKILDYASHHSLPIHWGSKGFSLNVDKNGIHVAVCFGYPPNSVYKQSIYTALVGRGGLLSKLDIPEQTITALWQEAEAIGLFQQAGKELKCLIEKKLSLKEIDAILNWLEKVITIIQQHNLK